MIIVLGLIFKVLWISTIIELIVGWEDDEVISGVQGSKEIFQKIVFLEGG